MKYLIALNITLESGQRLVYHIEPDQVSIRKAIVHILRQAQDKDHPVNYGIARHIIDGIREMKEVHRVRTSLESKRGELLDG